MVANEHRVDGNYTVIGPTGKSFTVPYDKHWVYSEDNLKQMIDESRIYFGKNRTAFPRKKRFLSEVQQGRKVDTWWTSSEVGHNQEAKREIRKYNFETTFPTPKPTRLIERIVTIATNKDDIIMDSFAGSGTTGQAVFNVNKRDKGSRRFVLIEMESGICESITFNRLNSTIEEAKLSTGFSYCELGSTLFDSEGKIMDEVSYNDLARHIYFCETGEPLPKTTKGNSPLLGIHKGIAIYLLYNGILKDKKVDGGNVLTSKILAELPEYDGKKVIYGTACRFSDKRLRSENIAFKQTPYEIRIS